jgi:hypothetical protein
MDEKGNKICARNGCSKEILSRTPFCNMHQISPSKIYIARDSVMCRLTINRLKFIINNIKDLQVVGRYEKGQFGEFLELRDVDEIICKYYKLDYKRAPTSNV